MNVPLTDAMDKVGFSLEDIWRMNSLPYESDERHGWVENIYLRVESVHEDHGALDRSNVFCNVFVRLEPEHPKANSTPRLTVKSVAQTEQYSVQITVKVSGEGTTPIGIAYGDIGFWLSDVNKPPTEFDTKSPSFASIRYTKDTPQSFTVNRWWPTTLTHKVWTRGLTGGKYIFCMVRAPAKHSPPLDYQYMGNLVCSEPYYFVIK
jgi:hypothetical protein